MKIGFAIHRTKYFLNELKFTKNYFIIKIAKSLDLIFKTRDFNLVLVRNFIDCWNFHLEREFLVQLHCFFPNCLGNLLCSHISAYRARRR